MKELLSTLAIALTLIAFVPYIFGILKGKTKPHPLFRQSLDLKYTQLGQLDELIETRG